MNELTPKNLIQGSCHCGAIEVRATLAVSPNTLSLRKCDCSFCTKHGAAYLSDAQGSLTYATKPGKNLKRYRQGDEGVAEFLFCDTCGVLVGVLYTEASQKKYSAINGTLFDPQIFADATPVSPQKLPRSERMERWKKLWFNNVDFK